MPHVEWMVCLISAYRETPELFFDVVGGQEVIKANEKMRNF